MADPTHRVLTTPEEILDACRKGGIVVFVGDESPFGAGEDEDDDLVACKVMGPPGEQTFFVIGTRDKTEEIQRLAKEMVEKLLGGTITSFDRVH